MAFACFSMQAEAQEALTNNGNMQVHAGGTINVVGNFTNASTASLVNNGNLYVKATITNNQASMSAGSGTVYINGTSPQAVNGSQTFKAWHLVTNNSSGITLNNNLSIGGTHSFTAGIITSSATPNYLVYEAGSSYTGDNDTRHVNGWVKKIGSTDFTFPVGNGTVERPMALGSLSASSEFNVRYASTVPPNYNRIDIMSLVEVNRREYWTVNRVSGGSATVTLNWDHSKVQFPGWILADIRVAAYDGSVYRSAGGSASGSVSSTGTITSNSISSFSYLTFGSVTYVVPMTLLNFNAYRKDNYTQVNWTTVNEYGVDKYIVERSDNGTDFYTVAQLPAHNNASGAQYSSRDYNPIQNIAYYRLRSRDLDGKETFSRIVTLTATGSKQLTLLANPVRDNITLVSTALLNGTFNYNITDMNGRPVQQGKFKLQNVSSYRLELNSITPGTYVLEVNDGHEKFTFKLIVQ